MGTSTPDYFGIPGNLPMAISKVVTLQLQDWQTFPQPSPTVPIHPILNLLQNGDQEPGRLTRNCAVFRK